MFVIFCIHRGLADAEHKGIYDILDICLKCVQSFCVSSGESQLNWLRNSYLTLNRITVCERERLRRPSKFKAIFNYLCVSPLLRSSARYLCLGSQIQAFSDHAIRLHTIQN